ncbi:hypothetical protein SD467_003677 [Vibrio parahaemolyticus]|nr:hypothetical protein [Vibrio parahaemolyticus]
MMNSTLLASLGTTFIVLSNTSIANEYYETVDLKFYDSYESEQYKESNHNFLCDPGFVLVGRRHSGDENGKTWYSCSKVLAGGIPVILKEIYISPPIKESWSDFTCPTGSIMTGRAHQGDENGNTLYICHHAYTDNDNPVRLVEQSLVGPQKESNSDFDSRPDKKVITGRKHNGDENGNTWMSLSGLSIKKVDTSLTFNLVAPPGLISWSHYGQREKIGAYWYNKSGEKWEIYPNGTTGHTISMDPVTNGDGKLRSYYQRFEYTPTTDNPNYSTLISISTLDEDCMYAGQELSVSGKRYYVDISTRLSNKGITYRTVNDFSVCSKENKLTLELKPIVNEYLLPYTLYSYNDSYSRDTSQNGYIPLLVEE